MERFPRQPRFRHAAIVRPLVIAAVTALALVIVAAAAMAETNRSSAAPSNTQPPVVSGTPEVGKELSTTNGTWSGTTPFSFSYQWRRCDKTGGGCANISGATDNQYKLQGADGDNTLRAVVTAKNSDGSDNATSVPTAVIPGTPVSNNGCPANKSAKVAPIAELAPPARLQIDEFHVTTGPINKETQSFSMQVRVGSTCGVAIQGASVYVTAVPYNQFDIPDERLTGNDGTATLSFRRLSNFPASSKQQQLTFFIRATKPGEDILAGVSTRRLVAVNFSS
jgi:hypothetical protein